MSPSRRQVCTAAKNRKRRPDMCFCSSRFINGVGALRACLHGLLMTRPWLSQHKYFFSSFGTEEVYRLAQSYWEVGAKVIPGLLVEAISFVSLQKRNEAYSFRNDPVYHGQAVMALWHGCTDETIKLILADGFKLPVVDNTLNGNKCGFGSYFSVCSAYACKFSTRLPLDELPSVRHYKYVLLCEVVSGVSYETTKEMKGIRAPPDGFHSVKGLGKYTQDHTENFVDSKGVTWPLGPFINKREERRDYEFVLDEIVVYEPKRINPIGFYEFKYASRK